MTTVLQRVTLSLLLLVFAACSTVTSDRDWPADLPNRKIFVDDFLAKRNIKTANKEIINEHLLWIVRFYQGTLLYPNGWNRASERFIASIEGDKAKAEMAQRLYALGIKIANEWAQDNDVRKINNTHVATWGSALRTSAARDDQSGYVSKVERDVVGLISGEIDGSEIDYERYYPSEEYDDF